jgi:hypothetical protein
METAAVKVLDPDHPLMSRPNKITSKDFEGWSVERAVNIPQDWASEYKPLLESSDPGEEANRGGLLIARPGEGTYIYTTLSLRRQLLAGNAGVYRMLSNVISLPRVEKAPAKPQ